MANSANVQDIEALKSFRLSLITFADKATNAIGEADSEVQRVTMWLENEQTQHWAAEMRKRHEQVMKAKEGLRHKQIFKSPTGGKQSTVDEEKAVAVAMRNFAEAEQKAAAVKKWIRQIHKESHIYRGAVQRLGTTVSVDVPNAASKIGRMITSLEAYVTLAAPNLGPAVGSGDGSSGVSRGEAGPDVGGGHKNLRQRTPLGPAKDAAPKGDAAVKWTGGEFAVGDAEVLAKLPLERMPLDPAASVILAAGVQPASRMYLERSAPAFPGDSGWYIGIAEGPAVSSQVSLRMDNVLSGRPHFAELLALPVGTLIVLDPAGVAAVLNEKDEDIWVR